MYVCNGCGKEIWSIFYCGLSHHLRCMLCEDCSIEVEEYIAKNGNVCAPGLFDHGYK